MTQRRNVVPKRSGVLDQPAVQVCLSEVAEGQARAVIQASIGWSSVNEARHGARLPATLARGRRGWRSWGSRCQVANWCSSRTAAGSRVWACLDEPGSGPGLVERDLPVEGGQHCRR